MSPRSPYAGKTKLILFSWGGSWGDNAITPAPSYSI